jgi:hypothetical protein
LLASLGGSIVVALVAGCVGGLVPAIPAYFLQRHQNKEALKQYERQRDDQDRREAEQRRREDRQRAGEVLDPIRRLLEQNQPDDTITVEEHWTEEAENEIWKRWEPLNADLSLLASTVASQATAARLRSLAVAVNKSLSMTVWTLAEWGGPGTQDSLEEARRRHEEALAIVDELIEEFRAES